jgi:molybdenum cofactor biosynthesis enzyme MoaA
MIAVLSSNFPKQTLRIKITGRCNLRCEFCHEEGKESMKQMSNIEGDEAFLQQISDICSKEGIEDIVLTGGEPTLNPKLSNIIKNLSTLKDINSIRLVTNGSGKYSDNFWLSLKENGLTSITFSVHDLFGNLVNQNNNVDCATKLGLYVKVNMVVYDTLETLTNAYNSLLEFKDLDIVLLNNVYNVKHSKQIISEFLELNNFIEHKTISRDNTSNAIKIYTNPKGKEISVKQHILYKHPEFCNGCNTECHEGYYGLRFEKQGDQYYIRTCLDRSDSATLIPVKDFISR